MAPPVQARPSPWTTPGRLASSVLAAAHTGSRSCHTPSTLRSGCPNCSQQVASRFVSCRSLGKHTLDAGTIGQRAHRRPACMFPASFPPRFAQAQRPD